MTRSPSGGLRSLDPADARLAAASSSKLPTWLGGGTTAIKDEIAALIKEADADGSGYEFLGDIVLKIDKLNGGVAARMVGGFTRWRKYDEKRQGMMKAQLERIVGTEGLSENVFEIVSKSLE